MREELMKNKVAIVSGGSRGLGKEIALGLASDGYHVVVSYAQSAAEAEVLVRYITAQGGKALACKADVAIESDVDRLFAFTQEKFGQVDVVINTAAISILKPLSEFNSNEFNRVISTNLTGTFHILQHASKHLSAGGRILTFSSNVVTSLPANYAVYAASKAAVEVLSKTLAKELRGREITVNIVSPGPTATDMFLEGKSEDLISQFAQASPFGRLGTPEDILRVVRFLIGPEAVWINGQVIKINGGAN